MLIRCKRVRISEVSRWNLSSQRRAVLGEHSNGGVLRIAEKLSWDEALAALTTCSASDLSGRVKLPRSVLPSMATSSCPGGAQRGGVGDEAIAKGNGIERGEDAVESVVSGRAMGQLEPLAQPVFPLLEKR